MEVTPLETWSQRSLHVEPEHLTAFRSALAELRRSTVPFSVDGSAIDALVVRTGDTYPWHVEPGAGYRESALLRARMEEAAILPEARLAHGALGLIHALRMAYLQDPERPMRGVRDVRFTAPVFEGAKLTVATEPEQDGMRAFAVTSDQLVRLPARGQRPEADVARDGQPKSGLALTGNILSGSVEEGYDEQVFADRAEQQLFTLEESIGLVSALIGLWGGVRKLYLGQSLELHGLVAVNDTLTVTGEIVEQRASRHGDRVTVRVQVREGQRCVAGGESIFVALAPLRHA